MLYSKDKYVSFPFKGHQRSPVVLTCETNDRHVEVSGMCSSMSCISLTLHLYPGLVEALVPVLAFLATDTQVPWVPTYVHM